MAQLARVLERVCAASFSIGMIADRFLDSDVLHALPPIRSPATSASHVVY